MLAATFALLGVLLGGVLNGVVAWRLEQVRNRGAARVSARLISDHLVRIGSALDPDVRRPGSGGGISRDSAELLLADWAQHRERLATTLSTDDWQVLANAIDLVRVIVGLPDDARVRQLLQAAARGDLRIVEQGLAALRTAE